MYFPSLGPIFPIYKLLKVQLLNKRYRFFKDRIVPQNASMVYASPACYLHPLSSTACQFLSGKWIAFSCSGVTSEWSRLRTWGHYILHLHSALGLYVSTATLFHGFVLDPLSWNSDNQKQVQQSCSGTSILE